MWDLNKDAGTIANIGVCSHTATVIEFCEHPKRIGNNFMRPNALNAGNCTYSTCVFLKSRIIHSLLLGIILFHKCIPFLYFTQKTF